MGEYVQLQAISKRFGEFAALESVSFGVKRGELLSLVGPSGAGKTTLLRILAGLEMPSSGMVHYEKAITRDHPAILVFQDYLLFPHMTVFDNVAFGLRSRRRRRRASRAEIRERVMCYLEQLGIADKVDHWPGQLSGGQRQRVALARALVMEPALLLLDEPFANLDKNLKRETAQFIRSLQQDLGVTTVIVSHDLEETSEISDRIGVIIEGRLQQIASFHEVYFHPRDLEVARMFGPVNIIPEHLYDTLTSLRSDAVVSRMVCARAESFDLRSEADGPGTITDLRLVGGNAHYIVAFRDWDATVRAAREGYHIGDTVSLHATEVFTLES
ncbi:MAG: ABC transporter ATP-binding protein [Spirochaetales bacterium]|nr:ABC transporter ATP-binding protein [Spirochaetales bacterium]